jgi:GDP-L-fucose synthase
LGSSCIYPRLAKQPILENELLSGPLETTNEGYALAKIWGLKMCDFYRDQYGCNFISAMPTSIYGINDNFDFFSSHLIPALIRKFHEAKIHNENKVVIWGSGTPFRELMYADDLANALLFLMENYDEKGHINVGTGKDYSIMEYAKLIKSVVGFQGEIVCDTSKPDGTPRKLLDVSKLTRLGWTAKTSLETGIGIVYR